ncbi:hypothetical protein [Oxynema aestuarii]|jgi:type III secretory pathway component EscS|uniref:Uncharacterized protein n=1 Tax=Oxynema aestuarii AP17 TaxID=2064643 RepID=A0A6H1U507_9CYAN|nr:hypothetical protein [Oxynema aestuarii]QIZ72709.1 hypothetical protein HCG48_20665 [Oxynema aestuarii AP17]RMH70764.1 MAG: hypothetical protein D6680_22840 [Cyanobacteria bacterium J007]
MDSTVGFILKVIVASAVLSVAIKWVGPQFALPATATIAAIGVFTPPAILALLLSWRMWQQRGE